MSRRESMSRPRSGYSCLLVPSLLIAACGPPSSARVEMTSTTGQGGFALLEDTPDGGLLVTLRVATSVADTGAQPAHIHRGSNCQDRFEVRYTLNDVVDGGSTTELPARLADVWGNHSIDVHRSDDPERTVACGSLK
jgi:hypothetical protein